VLELAEKVISLTGSRSRIEARPLPPDDPEQRQPDISLAKKELDWAPLVSLDEGLKKTIEYFENLFRSSRGNSALTRVLVTGAGGVCRKPYLQGAQSRRLRADWPRQPRKSRDARAPLGAPGNRGYVR
jgi:hypothetical protein